MEKRGKVWLAGAGPGDAELLTIKTKNLLEEADVIVYDSLISVEIMSLIPKEKECIFVGKRAGNHAVPQEGINKILLEEALKGKKVALLDTDIGLRNLDVVMGLENRIVYDIVDVVEDMFTADKYDGKYNTK